MKKCANPRCGKEFEPKKPGQVYHSAPCHRSAMKRLVAARIAAHRAEKGIQP